MRRLIRRLPLVVLVAAAGAGAALAATTTLKGKPTVRAAKSASFGTVLVAANGHSLYRYTPDRKGVSVCKGACLTLWPALLVRAGAKPTVGGGAKASLLGTIGAGHGKLQVTYAGFPLYLYAGDRAAGQTNGQGVDGAWHLVGARGGLVTKAASPGTQAQQGSTAPTSTTNDYGWG